MKSRGILVLAVLAAFVSIGLTAQEVGTVSSGASAAPAPPKGLPDFGPAGQSSIRIPAWDFSPLGGGGYTWPGGGIGRYPTASSFMEAAVHVPGGANITRLEFDYCDTNPTSHMSLVLAQCDNQGQNCLAVSNFLASSTGGCNWTSQGGLSIPVNNFGYMYELEAGFGALDGTNVLTGAIVTYQLQVSPAPGSATFNDVPVSDPAFQFIEALVSSGITAGCGGGNYCPDAPLTRRQMAVFISKGLGLNFNME